MFSTTNRWFQSPKNQPPNSASSYATVTTSTRHRRHRPKTLCTDAKTKDKPHIQRPALNTTSTVSRLFKSPQNLRIALCARNSPPSFRSACPTRTNLMKRVCLLHTDSCRRPRQALCRHEESLFHTGNLSSAEAIVLIN